MNTLFNILQRRYTSHALKKLENDREKVYDMSK